MIKFIVCKNNYFLHKCNKNKRVFLQGKNKYGKTERDITYVLEIFIIQRNASFDKLWYSRLLNGFEKHRQAKNKHTFSVNLFD
jgi:hypothetical protein